MTIKRWTLIVAVSVLAGMFLVAFGAASSSTVSRDYPPTLPAFLPSASDVVTGCVGSDYVVAWVVMEKLTEDPPTSPLGVQAYADGYLIPLGSVLEVIIEGVCWMGQGFARDDGDIAIYKAPCDNPQEVTRVR